MKKVKIGNRHHFVNVFAADEIERLRRLADDAEELFSHFVGDDDDIEMWRQSYRSIQAGEPDPFGDLIESGGLPEAQQRAPKKGDTK